MYHENIVNELLEWIEQRLEDSLNLQLISERSGYSKWYLQRLFKKHTGLALATYIRKRRMTMAANQLRGSTDSILDITIKYQFGSQATFTRVFKRHFNVTPAAYRKSCGLSEPSLQPMLFINKEITGSLSYDMKNKRDSAMLVLNNSIGN
ncbi:helix-turn-helix domain-containing protein [Pectobacterium carotovorum]|uniref:helix-turn-helix domain-containing protein n=1 Tax=Pectobacterium carotovorum TaxID=554 RepID=UPI00301A0C07